jgi:hypothetical protein
MLQVGVGLCSLPVQGGGPSGPALNAPTIAVEDGVGETHTADEGDELTVLVTVDDGDGGTTSDVELYLNGALVDSMTDDGGGDWSYALTDVLPGSHTYRAKRITDLGSKNSATWLVTVAAEVPSLDAPLDAATVTIGDSLTFEATGTVDGFDDNTTKVEFYVAAVLRATATEDTVGVWTEDWDTTGADPAVAQSVVAKRYWTGVSGQTGTAESVDDVEIELEEGGVAPVLVSAEIDATGLELTMTYDQALDDASVPDLGDFALDGTASGVDSVDVDGMTVVLTLDAAVFSHETVTLDYTAGANPIQNAAAQAAANLVDEPVTNGSTVFSPAGISDLVGWADMQDASGYTLNGSDVASIVNKAGSASWSQANASLQNPFSAAALNGFPCVQARGVDGCDLKSTEAAVYNAVAGSLAYTLFIVAELDTLDRTDAIFAVGNSGVAANRTRFWGQSTTGAGRWISQTVNDAGTTVSVNSAASSDGNPRVLEWWSPGTTVSGSRDGAAADPSGATQDPGVLTPNNSALFSRPDSSEDFEFDGNFGELLLYARELTSGERSQVRAYLGAKWGITVA